MNILPRIGYTGNGKLKYGPGKMREIFWLVWRRRPLVMKVGKKLNSH